MTQVEFFVQIEGYTAKSIGIDSDGSNGWSAHWNSNKKTAGNYDLWAVATDTFPQSTTSEPVAVQVGSSDSGDGGPGKCRPKKDCP